MREKVPQMTVLRQRISRAKDLLDHTEEEKSLDDVSKTIQSIKDIMKIAQQIAADLRRALHNLARLALPRAERHKSSGTKIYCFVP